MSSTSSARDLAAALSQKTGGQPNGCPPVLFPADQSAACPIQTRISRFGGIPTPLTTPLPASPCTHPSQGCRISAPCASHPASSAGALRHPPVPPAACDRSRPASHSTDDKPVHTLTGSPC